MIVVFALGGAALAGETPPSRDQIWRSIFARNDTHPGAAAPVQIALGKTLFHDTRLSVDGTRSCASCHQPARGFTDGLPRAAARDGGPLSRNTPHLWNLAWAPALNWDGRETSFQDQARRPITSPEELGSSFPAIAARLEADPAMADAFAQAFPNAPAISEASILDALAAYERSLVSPPTRFDAWVAGDDGALSPTEKAGFDIFVGKGGCVSCHGGWRFTDDGFHDIGLESADPGRGAITGGSPGIPAFKTPGLRELSQTAPYMHNGSLATLDAAVEHYAGGLTKRTSLSPNIVRDLQLNAEERRALIAFLATLSSESAAESSRVKEDTNTPKR
jgi:cytochrome c peroxidase